MMTDQQTLCYTSWEFCLKHQSVQSESSYRRERAFVRVGLRMHVRFSRLCRTEGLLVSLVSSQMVEILFQYAEHSLKKCPEQGKIQLLEQHFQVDEATEALLLPY